MDALVFKFSFFNRIYNKYEIEWLELFIPQHSDLGVFEQLISKWEHSKKVIADVLVNKYNDLMSEI